MKAVFAAGFLCSVFLFVRLQPEAVAWPSLMPRPGSHDFDGTRIAGQIDDAHGAIDGSCQHFEKLAPCGVVGGAELAPREASGCAARPAATRRSCLIPSR